MIANLNSKAVAIESLVQALVIVPVNIQSFIVPKAVFELLARQVNVYGTGFLIDAAYPGPGGGAPFALPTRLKNLSPPRHGPDAFLDDGWHESVISQHWRA